MKLVVVGGVAGGASAAARVRRLDAKAEIVMFEKGEHVSFSNCALPYHLGNVVPRSESLVLMSPGAFKRSHDIEARTMSEVVSINRDRKTVTVKDLLNNDTYEESYDKLVLAPGARPIMPRSIQGIDRDNVFSIRNVTDIIKVKSYVDRPEVQNVVVVGGGFIGIETAENVVNAGKHVALIEGLDQIMAPFDYDMVQILHKELDDNGIDLNLSSTVTAIEDGFVTAVRTGADGEKEEFKVPADCVIMSIGVAPETGLAKDAGLEIGETGGIKVNKNFQTSDPDIYAVGDAVEIFNMMTGKPGRLALAGPAQWEARAAADHICGVPGTYKGFIGSSCVRVFSQNAACTGFNEKTAAREGYNFDSVMVFPND
ncbi:MAG: FAD-dependent oxidoreductase, partial [Firmicutes bacterium]|nr:FAD-dependent oxidoreductase [Bacillota bacterium]